MTKTICSVTRSTDGRGFRWLSSAAVGPRSDGAGEVNAVEIRIAKLVPVLSLAILLTAAALAWSWASRNTAVTAAHPGALSTNDIVVTVGTKSLAAQMMKDRTNFPAQHR